MFQLLCLFILFESSMTLLPLKTSSTMSRNKGIEKFLTALAKSGGLLLDREAFFVAPIGVTMSVCRLPPKLFVVK